LIESGKLFDDNDACKLYLVAEAVDDPDTIWVIDRWLSQDEHERALKQPELRPFVEESLPPLVGMPEQIKIRPVGGKGLSLQARVCVSRAAGWPERSGWLSPTAPR
jgi:quinol monooxygenase YgiN